MLPPAYGVWYGEDDRGGWLTNREGVVITFDNFRSAAAQAMRQRTEQNNAGYPIRPCLIGVDGRPEKVEPGVYVQGKKVL